MSLVSKPLLNNQDSVIKMMNKKGRIAKRSRRTRVRHTRINEITLAALDSIERRGLWTVNWLSKEAEDNLLFARSSFKQIREVVRSIEGDKVSSILAAMYEVDVGLFWAAHHAIWSLGRDICPSAMDRGRDMERGAPESFVTSRQFTPSGIIFLWSSGSRQYVCSWEAQGEIINHTHYRQY